MASIVLAKRDRGRGLRFIKHTHTHSHTHADRKDLHTLLHTRHVFVHWLSSDAALAPSK